MMFDYSMYLFDFAIDPLLIGGALALGSSVASAIAAKRQQRRQNKLNKEMSKYQNTLSLEQWNRENEYNTPVAQMQRLKDAGVNPRIWWSNGTNTSASSPNLSAPELQYNAVGGQLAKGLSDTFGSAINAVNQMNSIRMQEDQMKLIQAQTKHYDTLSMLNSINANLRQSESILRNIDVNYYDLSRRQQIYGKQLVLNSQLASYLNNYGNSLLTNDAGMLSVDLNSPIWKETPMTTLLRRQVATRMGLEDAKRVESFWNSKAKQKGLDWLNTRMYSEKLRQNLMSTTDRLLRFKKDNEITKNDLLHFQKDYMGLQMDFMKEQIERKRLENFNYLPVLGDISSYPQILLNNFTKRK